MSRDLENPSLPILAQETALQPTKRSSRIAVSLLLTGLGGFFGGMLTSYGPTYLNVHLTQPVLSPEHVAEVTEQDVSAPVSAPAQEEPRPTMASRDDAALVIHSHDRSYLLLQSSAPTSLGRGPIQYDRASDGLIVTLNQAVRRAALSEEYQSYDKREFVLHDAGGYLCTATAGRLRLIQQIATDYEPSDAEPPTWDEYGSGPLLVAELNATRGNCKKALWARDASLPPAGLARISPAGKALRRQTRAAFRSSETYRALQASFEAEQGIGPWDDQAVTTFTAITSATEELVFISVQVGGCGEFEAQVGMVWRRTRDGALEAIATGDNLMLRVDAAADVDGDGDLDLMSTGDGFDRSLMRRNTPGFGQEQRSMVSIHYCRC